MVNDNTFHAGEPATMAAQGRIYCRGHNGANKGRHCILAGGNLPHTDRREGTCKDGAGGQTRTSRSTVAPWKQPLTKNTYIAGVFTVNGIYFVHPDPTPGP